MLMRGWARYGERAVTAVTGGLRWTMYVGSQMSVDQFQILWIHFL